MTRAFAAAAVPALALLAYAGATDADEACDIVRLDRSARKAGVTFVHDRGGQGEKHYPETMGAGLAWLDYDGDGWLDLYLVQSGTFPPAGDETAANQLYRNRGDGTFEDVTEHSGAGHRGYGQGVVAADVDGDGDTDLFLANYGSDALLRNRGDGTFEDATQASGLGLDGWSSSAAFADADNDGDLDLYVARYLIYAEDNELFCGDAESGRRYYCDPAIFAGESDRFFKNRGDGTFVDATAEAGFGDATGKGMGVVFTDFDGDLRPDVYVANDLTLNSLFRNRGDGTFEDLALLSGTALNREGKPEAGMGVTAGDVDGDGEADLAVTNFDVETNTLYRNLGALLFEDVAATSGFGPPSFNFLAFGIVLTDLDLDGDLDAYIANGHVREEPRRENVTYAERDLILLGDGAGRFRELRCPWLDENPGVGRGLAWADADNDGDPDLGLQQNNSAFELLRNEGRHDGHWLGLRLRGRPTIGTRIRLQSGDRRQNLRILAGDSYQSSSDPRVLFGLSSEHEAADVEVTWPDGGVTAFTNLPLNLRFNVLHPSSTR